MPEADSQDTTNPSATPDAAKVFFDLEEDIRAVTEYSKMLHTLLVNVYGDDMTGGVCRVLGELHDHAVNIQEGFTAAFHNGKGAAQ